MYQCGNKLRHTHRYNGKWRLYLLRSSATNHRPFLNKICAQLYLPVCYWVYYTIVYFQHQAAGLWLLRLPHHGFFRADAFFCLDATTQFTAPIGRKYTLLPKNTQYALQYPTTAHRTFLKQKQPFFHPFFQALCLSASILQ